MIRCLTIDFESAMALEDNCNVSQNDEQTDPIQPLKAHPVIPFKKIIRRRINNNYARDHLNQMI